MKHSTRTNRYLSAVILSCSTLLTCGCTSGLVLHQDKDECNYIANVSGILTVYGESTTANRNLKGKAQNVPIEASADSNKSKSVVILAKMLDQINSQSYPFLLTAIAAKNMNPCDVGTDKRFWATLNNIINKAYRTRSSAVKLEAASLPKDDLDKDIVDVYDYLKGYEYYGK